MSKAIPIPLWIYQAKPMIINKKACLAFWRHFCSLSRVPMMMKGLPCRGQSIPPFFFAQEQS
jgi:hypothetical protein